MFRKAFTLVELLVVISIIAILSAIFLPVVKACKSAAYKFTATSAIRQLGSATSLYTADSDDTMPLAMYIDHDFVAWFGRYRSDHTFDTHQGILSSYLGSRPLHDQTHVTALPYLGDQSGFGYNWGYLGSDFNITLDYRKFPNCTNPAKLSQLENPSGTIEYATSSFYNAPWLPKGDGMTYDFGFVDPPSLWHGDPNMDFRHIGSKKVDILNKQVTSSGQSVVVFADGSAKGLRQEQVKDNMFERQTSEQAGANGGF